ncbi:hypothetical protein ACVMBY_000289 [Bradyrhizobium huanghuaihaiense]
MKIAVSLLMLMLRSMPSTSEPTGPVIPARKRGFCRNMADSSVEPARGSPEMKWISPCMILQT